MNCCKLDLNSVKDSIFGKSIKPAVLFVVFATIQFFYFFSNYGPLTSCDPDLHIPGAYSLASGQCFDSTLLTTDSTDVNGSYSGHALRLYLPENLSSQCNKTYKGDLLSSLLLAQNDDMWDAQKAELIDREKSNKIVSSNTGVNQYFPISWLAPALGMKVGMLLEKSSWGILQLGRMSNYLIYLVIVVSSVVIIPGEYRKLVLSIIGCCPWTVFVASSIMSDAFLIALCALYVSIALHFIFNRKVIEIKHMLMIAFLTLLLMLVKLPYGSLALLFIFMQKDVWGSKPKILTCTVTFALFVAIYLIWSRSFQSIHIAPGVDYSWQLSYLYRHLVFVVFNCLVNCLFSLSVTLPFHYVQLFLFIVVLAFLILVKYNQELNRLVMLAILATVITMMTTYLFLFLTWNNYQGLMPHFLDGFQERYLLPLLPLLLVMCQRQRTN